MNREQAFKAFHQQDPAAASAFQNYRRDLNRRDWAYKNANAQVGPCDEPWVDEDPGPLELLLLAEGEEKAAVFLEDNRELIENYHRTPSAKRRIRKKSLGTLLRRLRADGFDEEARCVERNLEQRTRARRAS